MNKHRDTAETLVEGYSGSLSRDEREGLAAAIAEALDDVERATVEKFRNAEREATEEDGAPG